MTDLNRRDGLSEALRRLAEADRTMTASPAVEARLRAEVRSMGGRAKSWNRGTLLALAAAVTICVSVPAFWLRTQDQGTTGAPVGTTVAREATTEFFPLFYGSVPSSSEYVIRMEVPRASLTQFGLASAHDMDRTTGTVIADVLVGEDGLARAVRFVRPFSQEY
jgi:hypothetical protein